MSQPVVVREDARLEDVVGAMLKAGATAVAVVDGSGKLKGIITDDDFVPREQQLPFTTDTLPKLFGQWVWWSAIEAAYVDPIPLRYAKQVMHQPAELTSQDAPLCDAIHKMSSAACHCLPVVREGRPVGMLAKRDLLRLMTAGR
jgi:CBS domain-containing protein